MSKATSCAWTIRLLICTALAAQAAFAFGQENTELVSESDLREIANAYRTNRDKFNPFVIRYTHRIGTCATEENAKLGKLDEVTCTAEVKWAFDGKRTCFVKSSPDGSVQREFEKGLANAKDGYFTTPMSEEICYHSPDFAFNASPGAASFYKPSIQFAPTLNTPFDLGFMGSSEKSSLDRVILENLNSRKMATAERIAIGADDHVRVNYEMGTAIRVECILDPDKGHSIRDASYQVRNSIRTHIHVISTRQCANKGWMPEHVVKYHSHNGKFYVNEWVVTDVKCGGLAETDFEVTLPKGTQVNGPVADTCFNLEVDTLVNDAVAKEYWEIVQGKKRVATKPRR